MKTKWMLYKGRGPDVPGYRVWFIVQKDGRVTIDWVFTGKKHTVSKADARLIWRGLKALGFNPL